ncbi:DUF188 domain-containing protein [Cytobacillus sp. Hz8]|uniref:YaiI/YqxD family protein n=1 Tax=Cytobacillus sp. Hz8 TaxID=3347168 RepID=UPI0035DE623D
MCRITSTLGKPRIIVDADSCPVKEEIVEISERFSLEVIFVASYNHVMNDLTHGTWKFVDPSKEAADLFIMNKANAFDIVVTQDIGLASILLPMKVKVLSPRGEWYLETQIETALDLRYLSAKARQQGKYGKGPKPFTKDHRAKFKQELSKILSEYEGNL